VLALLQDPTLLTPSALYNCTSALTTSLRRSNLIASNDNNLLSVLSALSSVVQVGTALPKTLGIQISQTIDAIIVGREQQLVLGESTSVVTGSVKFYSKVGYGKDLYGYETPLPQTDLEEYLGVVPARTSFDVIKISTGRTSRRQLGVVGDGISSSSPSPYGHTTVTNTQTTNNYLDLAANTTVIKLKIGYEGVLNGSTTTITFPTVGLISYLNIPSVNGTVNCGLNSSSYVVPLNCTANPTLVATCPGNILTDIYFTCPQYTVTPSCLAWGSQLNTFAQVPECVVVQYDSNQTVCQCTGPTGYGDSEDDGGHVSYSNELAASAQIITSGFTNTVLHTKVDARTFAKNPVRYPIYRLTKSPCCSFRINRIFTSHFSFRKSQLQLVLYWDF